jgi:hypothetical protein
VKQGKTFRVAAIGGVVAIGVLVAAAVWAGGQVRSPAQAAAEAAPPPASAVTAEVERRVLSEPVVLRGKVTPGASVKLLPAPDVVGPNSVVTRVHTARNERVDSGDPVVEIAGRPLFAMSLPFAPYRDITGGSEGPDVKAVQGLLRDLGYEPGRSGKLDARTQQALAKFYRARGYHAPVDATAAEKLAAAQKAVEQAEAAYERAKTPQPTTVGAPPVVPETDLATAKEDLAEARTALAAAKVRAGPSLPRNEVVLLPNDGGRVTALHTKVGTVLKDGETPILELNGAAAFVSATVDADQASLLRKGMTSSVLDDTTGQRANAVITSVGTTQTTDSTTGSSGHPVALRFTGASMPASAERSVRVTIPVAASAEAVLSVPVTAVFSRPDGSTFLTVQADNGRAEDVTVQTGQIAGGWVEIKPEDGTDVAEGARVVVGAANRLPGTD